MNTQQFELLRRRVHVFSVAILPRRLFVPRAVEIPVTVFWLPLMELICNFSLEALCLSGYQHHDIPQTKGNKNELRDRMPHRMF